MFTISDCYAPNFVMEAIKDLPPNDNRSRVRGRNGLELMVGGRSSSPQPVHCGSPPKENNHHWWDVLKGLGKRRRKSTTNAYVADYFDVSWQLTQVEKLSEEKSTEEFITALAYDETGDLLATGCKDGKVIVHRQNHEKSDSGVVESSAFNGRPFHVLTSFQSHEKEFDHLKSVETDEKIGKLRWLKRPNRHNFLLSSNESNVKLWKLSERRFELDEAVLTNGETNYNFISSMRIPKYKPSDRSSIVAFPKRTYFAGHNLRMNSLSLNSDLETFLTADDLSINIWHVEIPDLCFNIVNAKPDNIDDLSEVITSAEFHPTTCSQFVYASSKGSIRLCDMRSNALCDQTPKIFRDSREDGQQKGFFDDIICCINDVKFSSDGQFMMSRDYLNLKVWDLRTETCPVETYPVCDPLRSKLGKLYENDHIFDKFDCSWGYNDRFIATGTYGNFFKIFDRMSGHGVSLNATSSCSNRSQRKRKTSVGAKAIKDDINVERLDFRKKCAHTLWNPSDHLLTSATNNCLHFYQCKFNSCELSHANFASP